MALSPEDKDLLAELLRDGKVQQKQVRGLLDEARESSKSLAEVAAARGLISAKLLPQRNPTPAPRRNTRRARAEQVLKPIPARMGSYELLKEIGEGRTGVLFEARHLTMDMVCCVKVLRPDGPGGEAAVKNALFQARRAQDLPSHPNIVPVLDHGLEADYGFVASELVVGSNLNQLQEVHPIKPEAAARAMAEIAKAIHFAHGEGLLHGGLKPENILVRREDGVPLVTDFGLARASSAATLPTASVETIGLMSPEEAEDERSIEVRSDVYGLGAVLYKALTGRAPHQGITSANIIASIISGKPADPRQFSEAIDWPLTAIVLKALARQPKDRFQNAADFEQALRAWLAKDRAELAGLVPELKAQGMNPVVLILILVAVLSLLFGLFVWILMPS